MLTQGEEYREVHSIIPHLGKCRKFHTVRFYFKSLWASLIAQLVENPTAMQETPVFYSWVRKVPWRRDRLPTPVFLGFPGGSVGKESACNAGDLGSIPGLRRSPGEGNGYPLLAWGILLTIVHGVAKSWTRLSNFHLLKSF